MKSFPDGMTRGTVVALLAHGLALVLVGGLVLDVALYSIKHPRGTGAPMWRLYTAGAGWALAVGTGVFVTILTAVKLAKPFAGPANAGLSHRIKTLFILEGIIVFIFGGMTLDGGETSGRMLLWAMVLNLALLGFSGRVTVSSESRGSEAGN